MIRIEYRDDCRRRRGAALMAALVALLCVGAHGVALAQQDPRGLWLTANGGGVIAVQHCGNALCGRIVGIVLDHATDPTPLDNKGASQCNLLILSNATPTGRGSWNGRIIDPRDGQSYGLEMRLDKKEHLRVRGYLGLPLLGRTEVWTRYPGRVPPDCRMVRAADGTLLPANTAPRPAI
jgi:uncharacterized protein (DUF2147 family)